MAQDILARDGSPAEPERCPGDQPAADCVAAREPGPGPRMLVIGLGNPLVSDDSVGLRVVAELKRKALPFRNLQFEEDYWGGLRLMEQMIGFQRAIVVDAICTGAAPGTIHHLTTDMLATQKSASAHDVNLPTALAFGRQAGADLPADRDIRLIGIEAQDVINFGDRCTPAVTAAIPRAVEEVTRIIESMLGEPGP